MKLCGRFAHEKEIKNLNNEIRDSRQQNDMLLNEMSEMKGQLRILDEQRDSLRHELLETNRKLREGLPSFFFPLRQWQLEWLLIRMFVVFLI